MIGPLHKAINVTKREPLAESGSYLKQSANDNERPAFENGGDFGDVVFGQRISLGDAELEEVPGFFGESVDISGGGLPEKRPAAGGRGAREGEIGGRRPVPEGLGLGFGEIGGKGR